MSSLILAIICVVAVLVLIFVLIGLFFHLLSKSDMKNKRDDILWVARKRNKLGLPWSFTKYSFSEDRIFVQKGVLKTTFDEVRMYRVMDTQLTQTLGQKLFGLGTVTLHTSDKSLKCFTLDNVKKSADIRELISQKIEEQRVKHRVYSREEMSDVDDNDSFDDCDE